MKAKQILSIAAAIALSATLSGAEQAKVKGSGNSPNGKIYATVQIAGSEDLTAFVMDYSKRIDAQQLGMFAAMGMAAEPMKTFGPVPKGKQVAVVVFGPAEVPKDFESLSNFSFAVLYPLSRNKKDILAANSKLKEKDGIVRLADWIGCDKAYAAIGDSLAVISTDRALVKKLNDPDKAAKVAASCGKYAKDRLVKINFRRPAVDMMASAFRKGLDQNLKKGKGFGKYDVEQTKIMMEVFCKLIDEVDRASMSLETEKDALLLKLGADCREGGELMKMFGAGLPAEALDLAKIADAALFFSASPVFCGIPAQHFREFHLFGQMASGLEKLTGEIEDAKAKVFCTMVAGSLKRLADKAPPPRPGDWCLWLACTDFAGSFRVDAVGNADSNYGQFLAAVDAEVNSLESAAKKAFDGKDFVQSKKDGSRYEYTLDLEAIVDAGCDAEDRDDAKKTLGKFVRGGKAVVELESGKLSRLTVRSEKGADSFKSTGAQKRRMEAAFPGVFGQEKVCSYGRLDTCSLIRFAVSMQDEGDCGAVLGILPKDGTPGVSWVSVAKGKELVSTLRIPDADVRIISGFGQFFGGGANAYDDEDDEDPEEEDSAEDAE